MTEADPALAVAHDDQRREAEALAALHRLRNAVNVDQLLDQLFAAIVLTGTTATTVVTTTTTAVATATVAARATATAALAATSALATATTTAALTLIAATGVAGVSAGIAGGSLNRGGSAGLRLDIVGISHS
jgi:hypothetical protein